MINKDELLYKMEVIIEYLKNNGGYNYLLYNKLCPIDNLKPDSNIVEYAEDVLEIIKKIVNIVDNK